MPRLPRTVWALAAVSFLTDAASELIAPLLPLVLTTALGASPLMLGLIEGAAESTAALLKLQSGRWSDRLRRRTPLVVAGYALAALVRPLVAFATSAPQVLAIRLLDRVGKGIRGAPRDALIADSVAPADRGRAFGTHRAADHAGAVVGPLVAWWLLQRGVTPANLFVWAAVPGALSVLVALVAVRESPRRRDPAAPAAPAAPDAPGARLASAAPTRGPALMAAPDRGTAPPLPSALRGVLLAIGCFTLANATDAFLLLRATSLGVPTVQLPLLWAALHLVKTVSSRPAGALSDRVGRRPLVVLGWSWYALVSVGFALAQSALALWVLTLAYGLVHGLTEGAEKALVADLAPPAVRGTAFGWYQLSVGVAALPASLLFGAIWTRWGAPAAFATSAALAVAALAVLLAAARREGPSGEGP